MKKTTLLLPLLLCFTIGIYGQNLHIPIDTTVTTNHTVNIKGERISYSATSGMQPVWNDEGEVTASLFYTYYKRTGISDLSKRPLVVSFNGGPGSASVWMHIAYTSPETLVVP